MSDRRYPILQGIEKTADDPGMHVSAVDSHKHSLELFLRPSEFLPSLEDAQELGDTRTPVVHAVLGPGMDVITFGRRLNLLPLQHDQLLLQECIFQHQFRLAARQIPRLHSGPACDCQALSAGEYAV